MTFTFAKEVPERESLTFSYESTVKMNDSLTTGATVAAKNEFSLGNGSKAEATVSYYKYGVKKYTWGNNWGADKKLTRGHSRTDRGCRHRAGRADSSAFPPAAPPQ